MKDSSATPTISRVLPDGTLIELLYDCEQAWTTLAICSPTGEVAIKPQVDLPTGERLVPYAASNNLLTTGCVLLPSAVGDFDGKGVLVEAIRSFIRRYVDLSPLYEEIAAHYVLLTWVYDALNELPYLRFQGVFGSGKTRALLTIGSIAYKPFFASGASTVSPIFHVLNTFGGTLVLDEADLRFSDATADLTKILNNGTMKGLPVLRTMANRYRELNPQAFRVFGPKIVAMRERFADEALESRFLTEDTSGRTMRADIALSLPDAMTAEALDLRNRLLAWRFAARYNVAIDPALAVAGLSPRGNQMALPLLSLIDDEALRRRIGEELVAKEARAAARRAASPEATMARILGNIARSSPTSYVPIGAAMLRYNEEAEAGGLPALSPKAAGWLVRTKLGLATTKSRGVYVIPGHEREKIESLAVRYGTEGGSAAIAPEQVA